MSTKCTKTQCMAKLTAHQSNIICKLHSYSYIMIMKEEEDFAKNEHEEVIIKKK